MRKLFKLECPDCQGWGFQDTDVRKQCATCAGQGRVASKAWYKARTGNNYDTAAKTNVRKTRNDEAI